MEIKPTYSKNLTNKLITKTWWPLAVSWLMMSLETPMLSAVIARLPDPRINLAAYGGVVAPIRTLIMAPVVMMLSASTALCKDWDTYRKLNRFMMILGGTLTVIHALLAFTPLYYVVVEGILGVPAEVYEQARLGLMISTPVGWGVGFRRFNQGILIRNGHSNFIMGGTIIRISGFGLVLVGGYLLGNIPGIVVEATALVVGVWGEAIFTGLRVRPVLRYQVKTAPAAEPLIWRDFFGFYIPLAFTSLLTMVWSPIASAAISRMPRAIDSLAVMPVINGLVFLFRSFGLALNEVIVTLMDRPQAPNKLWRFSILVALATSLLIFLVILTPLSSLWFETVAALAPDLAVLARQAAWLVLLLPALSAMRSWCQGILLFGRKTRGISEAIVVSLLTLLAVFGAGILLGNIVGVYVALAAYMLANLTQSLWLWRRSKPVLNSIEKAESKALASPVS
ncbi:MAG: hypothetical protein MUO76_11830 [Anaerolineaceae bacterium]|nr:hypothetical protein [Anaerolineaceae bacterium]